MKIGLIGDHITDIYIYGKMNRFSPESPIPIFDVVKQEYRAGGASNVNNNLMALGAYVDYFFDNVNSSIKKRYVCDHHIMFRCDEDKNSNIDIDQIIFPKETKYIILSDYNKGVLRDSVNLIKRLKSEGRTVVVDPKRPLEHYEGADIVKMNEEEFEKFYTPGVEYNIGTLVITMGGKGVKIIPEDGRIVTLSGLNNQVSDVTGAGDVFIAAMTFYLAKGKSIIQACDLANRYASKSVTKFGTYCITNEDIKEIEGKIIFTNGVFDILHPGHIQYLRESKALGSKLIVGINSDESVKKLKPGRPIHSQQDRKKILEALDCVDEVIIFDEPTPYNLIETLKPDIITKGGDYTKLEVVGNSLAEVVIIPYNPGYSTSNILERLNGDC